MEIHFGGNTTIHMQNLAAISAKIQDEAQMIGFLKQQTSEVCVWCLD